MKKIPVILALLTSCLFSFSFVYAQTSISGDSLCGATAETACNFSHLKSLVTGVMYFIIGLGLPLLIVIVAYRFVVAWFAAAQGQSGVYKEATKKAGQAILGFIILILLFGGALIVVLEYLGATDPVVKLLKLISSSGLIETASAQEAPLLPSPIGDTNLYDFILKLLSLVMRFFVYPALIVIWVATGFSFVLAQGKPEALSKAKKLLIWATVSTFIVVMIQAFLIAAKGTVEQVLPGSTNTQATSQEQTAAQANEAQCRNAGGTLAANGTSCNVSASRGGTNAEGYCNGKPTGSLCTVNSGSGSVTGICKRDNTTFGCFIPATGEACLTTNNYSGTIDSSRNCIMTVRPLIGAGGSCRISAECSSGTCLSSGVCQ